MIKNKTELEEKIDELESFILLGKLNPMRILLRHLGEIGKKDKVAAVSVRASQKRQESVVGVDVGSMKKLAKEQGNIPVVIVEADEERRQKAKELAEEHGFDNFSFVDYDFISELGSGQHVGLDFLCVGFVKCGTSTLHMALKKNKSVYLPKKKETLYLCSWKNKFDNGPEMLKTIYFPDALESGKVVGNIEPAYHREAESCYECFGKNTKIIFMVRNPVSATYSYFKMLMRKTSDMNQVRYYKKYRKFDLRMFDDYIDDTILSGKDKRFCYMDYIEQYLKYYDRENVKVVIFEEFIEDPLNAMNEIQDFIGCERKEYLELPHSNEGSMVSKNYRCAKINRKLYAMDVKLRTERDPAVRKKHEEYKKKIHKRTLVENNEKMLDSSRDTLNEYYRESIKRLEEFCGKSLEGKWY